MSIKSFEGLRKKILKIDQQIISLIGQRAKTAESIGKIKNSLGIPIYDRKRETQVLKAIKSKSPKILNPDDLEKIYLQVIQSCRQVQYRIPRSNIGKTRISIIGTGLIGGSIAKALRYQSTQYLITGFDKRRPKQSHIIFDKWARNIQEALESEIVILALPVDTTAEVAKKFFKNLTPGQIIIDTGSTKEEISKVILKNLPKGVHFVAGHPLAGKATSSFANSDADLFLNRAFVYYPFTKSHRAIKKVIEIINVIGAKPVKLNPKAHDQILSFSSHLPQIISIALSVSLSKTLKTKLFGPALMDMTRISASSGDLWHAILSTNQRAVRKAIQTFSHNLRELNSNLTSKKIKKYFVIANKVRKTLEKQF